MTDSIRKAFEAADLVPALDEDGKPTEKTQTGPTSLAEALARAGLHGAGRDSARD
jgi:hypothetical protein